MKKVEYNCIWESEKDVPKYYKTQCDNVFYVETHNVDNFKYCPFCGRKLKVSNN